MGVDSTFLKKENKITSMQVKCSRCGEMIQLYVNAMSSAGEAWPFCEKCGSYVDVTPAD